VCRGCGLVLGERRPDPALSGVRAFSREEREARGLRGCPVDELTPSLSLTTLIDRYKIKGGDLRRAAKWDTRMKWQERRRLISTNEIKRICGRLNIPTHTKKSAVRLYETAARRRQLRGRSIDAMAAACIYLACRTEKTPISLMRVEAESPRESNQIRLCIRSLLEILKITVPPVGPSNLVARSASELGEKEEVELLAVRLAEGFSRRTNTSGKDPKGICAAALYLASKLRGRGLNQEVVSRAAGVTAITLRSRRDEMLETFKLPPTADASDIRGQLGLRHVGSRTGSP